MQVGMLIAIWLLINIALVGTWDIYALFFLSQEETVSFWIQGWFRQLPILALSVGVVLGHLAWPLVTLQKKNQGGLP